MYFLNKIISQNRKNKVIFIALIDTIIAIFSVFLLSLSYDNNINITQYSIILFFGFISSLFSKSSFMMIRAFSISSVFRILFFSSLFCLFTALTLNIFKDLFLYQFIINLFLILFAVCVISRITMVCFFEWVCRKNKPQKRVIIYGAGSAGIQLKGMLAANEETIVVAFVDDNPALHHIKVGGLNVYPPSALAALLNKTKATEILLAIPSMSSERREKVLKELNMFPVKVLSLPPYLEMMQNQSQDMLSALRNIEADQLLGREVVKLEMPEIQACYSGKSILVSGAGGSIGSELCRQIITAQPKRLVLFEMSEFALYSIHQEILQQTDSKDIEVIAVLGSVCDRALLDRVFIQHHVEIVLHAAAYKHVPLVEDNPLRAAQNNVLGTHTIALAAHDADIERFVLVSTDKAVRPTNVMGATKRLAEMVIQDLQTRSKSTIFSMVRFGNVLGSSGSVIPLFKKQLSRGGPITVTHPEVTRYFMTIPEAARLVLLAGSFANGGEVFVLDMGASVKISDLARRMIEISGLTVKDNENPEGDIEIKYIGLRPGEKLYEELLLDDKTIATPHSKIMRAMERSKTELEISSALHKIRLGLQHSDEKMVRPVLAGLVDGYNPPDLEDTYQHDKRRSPSNVA